MTSASRSGRRARRSVAPRLVAAMLVVGAVPLGWEHVAADFAGATSAGSPLDAAAFSPGACMAFPPTVGDRHETVFLDAGHGGIDPGGVGATESGHTILEAAETLRVELDAMALLRDKGFRVVVSRTTSSTVLRLGAADVSDEARLHAAVVNPVRRPAGGRPISIRSVPRSGRRALDAADRHPNYSPRP